MEKSEKRKQEERRVSWDSKKIKWAAERSETEENEEFVHEI